MKNLSTLFMVIVILFGLILAMTPFIGSIFFTPPENSSQMAKSEVAKAALSRWFNVSVNEIVDVQAIRQSSGDKGKATLSRFSFSTTPKIVSGFIRNKQLRQKELSATVLQTIFIDTKIPWWQPEALRQETWFDGYDEGRRLSLIYNAKTRRGVLVIEKSPANSTQSQ